ncbi:MAG: P-type conjugative transfer ATPase TrbB [Parvularculaceae bacterium]|nr:P-type conjugative transfer ATPase TrbB [Parvularculaceae bacterium]
MTHHAPRSETALRRASMLNTAFGPVIGAALEDETVIEIMVNPDGALWIERHGKGLAEETERLKGADVERIIRLAASQVGFDCGRERPIVSAELPSGERFEGVLPPVAPAPCFSIRKAAGRVISLAEYIDAGIMTGADALILKSAIAKRQNILIAGGASSGKTTLANALLAEIAAAEDRIVILEDTRELRCNARDVVTLRTSPTVSLETLVRSTMRLRPDRIIVGEVRGGEALDLLKAWNTGHPGGIATVHANSAATALTRLEQLIGERTTQIPCQLIADAIDLVVFIRRGAQGRRVEEILRVDGLDHNGYRLAKPNSLELVVINEGATS